jgi:hypothetical protein
MNTAAAIRSEIARIEAQIADWSWRFPMGDAEPELRGRISDLEDELYVLEHPEEFAPISRQEAA